MRDEATFYRQLQSITTQIHATDRVEQIVQEVSGDVCRLFMAERMTLYLASDDALTIVSRVKTGLNSASELKLPVSPQSLAGFCALTQTLINVADVYDTDALKRIHPALRFLQEVDRRSGFRSKQMLVAPVAEAGKLRGVVQIINRVDDQPFSAMDVDGVTQLCKTLATAIRQRLSKAAGAPVLPTELRKPSRYDALAINGRLSLEDLDDALARARASAAPPEKLLQTEYGLTNAELGAALSQFFGVPYEPFHNGLIRSEFLHGVIKREFVESTHWIPLEDSPDGLVVMCLDPEAVRNSKVVPQIYPRFAKFAWRVTTQADFAQTLVHLYGAGADAGTIDQMLADMNVVLDEESGAADENAESAAADNELVKFVNKVIIDAYHAKASDIHVEPMPGKAKTGIRFRVDGSLVPYIEVPAQFRSAMVTRLKIMCDLDISERRKPQDGKIKFKKFGPLDIELRVATIPSAGGVEDVVMRILAAGEPIPLDQLGLTNHNRTRLEAVVQRPYGLFYVCGPTGSGKTTTLHSILKFLNTTETKIWTAEDPVEITQKGLRQVQINKKAGIDFALVMRAFLRADPDIIMVGESRDRETVAMGVEASLTGHLVFSTLHTNSAPESITRLLDMGMDPFNFADALLGILAQRLAKRLCGHCKESYEPSKKELRTFIDEYAVELKNTSTWQLDAEGQGQKLYERWVSQYGQDGTLKFYRAKGCDKCGGTGYKGRVGLHELLVADDTLKRQIQTRARVAELFATAVEAEMHTLKMDGMEKIMMGLTDLKQVRAVCIK
jgi:type II secretory ATPase GspE/PulE/Tfp pilus assembly ATPase PilB-like protein